MLNQVIKRGLVFTDIGKQLANGIELIPDSYDPTYRSNVYDFNEDDTPAIKILGKVVWWCKEF